MKYMPVPNTARNPMPHTCGKHDAAAPCLVQGQVRDRQDAAHHPGLWSSPMISTNRSSSVRRRPWMP